MSEPTPELVFDTLVGYQRSAALKGAIDLDLFTAIAEGADTAAALATRVGATERGVRSLCDFLTTLGFLEKDAERYSLSAVSARFLDRRQPTYCGAVSTFLCADNLTRAFTDLTGVVRRGGTLLGGQGTMESNYPVWVEFARGMVAVASLTSAALTERLVGRGESYRRALDVAAGHGLYGISLLKAMPDLRVTAVDWPPVLEVARKHAAAAGVAERLELRPGDAMQMDLGRDYDLVLLPNIIHHFDRDTCVEFLRRVRDTLRPAGRVATVEILVNDDRVTPPNAARFSLVMLATTAGGDAYTFEEMERMHHDAGFEEIETVALEPSMDHAVLARAPG